MKAIVFASVLAIVSVHSTFGGIKPAPTVSKNLQGTITLSGAWALYPMAVIWGAEFQKIHPKVKIDISAGGAGKGMADCLAKVADIGMVSRDVSPEEAKKGAWWVAVTRDAVVPTMNAANPLATKVCAHGISRRMLIDLWITGSITKWEQILGTGNAREIHGYTRSDACGAAQMWAQYLGKQQEDLRGIGVYGDPGVAEAVKKDPLGVGFNNINYVYDPKTKKAIAGLCVLPIDLDSNGVIDPREKVYDTRDALVKAIADGIYPSPPARDLYFVALGCPANPVVRAFIEWTLTTGQKHVTPAGYITLTKEQLDRELGKLQCR